VARERTALVVDWKRAIVSDARLTAADRHVALTLAVHMDRDGGSCFPSIRRLAAECKRKPHTISASVEHLELTGYLQVDRAAKRNTHGWSNDVNQYRAQLPLGATAAVAPTAEKQLPLGTTEVHKTSTNGAARPNGRAAVCQTCGTGGGQHAADCETLP